MNNKKDEIIILGAGLTGLSAAYHLKRGYSLFEKENQAGGMARSIYKDGYTFDYDGHLLHFRDEYVFKLVMELLDGNIAPHKRNAYIWSKDSYTRYPFQANFYGLPKPVVRDCLLGLIRARVNSPYKKVALDGNFEDWIKKTFGPGIAEHFMLPYNKKFWTIEPQELICDWLDRFVPVPTLEDTVTGAISDNAKLYGYNAKFWYPVKGGISEVVKAFLKKISNIHLNKTVVTIDQHKREVIFEDGTKKRFRTLVTTIPLPELFKILVTLPKKIREVFSLLKFTSIFVVNLGIKKDSITDKHWIYYPESNLIFYRTGFPTNFSIDVAPSERTSVYAEISYSERKRLNKKKAIRDTIKGLKTLGLICDEKEIEICLPIDIKYGYAIYDRNRNQAVKAIRDYLKEFDIHSIGRYGSWRYVSMEDAILEGKKVAEELLKSKR